MDHPKPTRRDVLRGLGAATLLAACGEEPTLTATAPDTVPAATGDTGVFDAGAADTAVGGEADANSSADAGAMAPDAADVAAPPDPPEPPDASIAPITPNADHFVTSIGDAPAIDVATWAIALLDRGSPVGQLGLPLLESLGAEAVEHTLECISANPGRQAISNAIWTGVTLKTALTAAGVAVPAGVVQLKFTGADGYTTALPLSDLDAPAWLVWRMNGEPLPPDHGFPARLLVPGRYGMKSPKWIVQLEFIDQPWLGTWEDDGWSDAAPYLCHTFIRTPAVGAAVSAGLVHVSGTAFAGSDPVVSVEVSVDEGPWQKATLDYAPGPNIWTLWSLDVTLAAGHHKAKARCTTAAGVMSQADAFGSQYPAGYQGSMELELDVA